MTSPSTGKPLAWLWQAHPSVQGAVAQRRARVAAAILVCLFALGLAALATIPLAAQPDASGTWLLLGALVGIAVSYGVVRMGQVPAGTLLALLLVELVIWLSRLDTSGNAAGQAILYYLGIPLLVAGLLLSAQRAAGFGLATLLSAWVFEALIDQRLGGGLDAEDVRLLIFLGAVAVLAVAASTLMQRETRYAEESAAQLRLLAENIPEVFFVVAPDFSKTYYVSPAYEKAWGRPLTGSEKDPLDWLKGVHPDDMLAMQASLAQAQQDPSGVDFRVLRPDGTIRHMHGRTFPVQDAKGATIRIVGLSEDVTDAKVAADLLREANAKLKATASERQRMFQQISHDLANPLSPLLMQLGVLGRAKPGQDLGPSVQVMRRNADQIKRLVEDLRDLARIEGSRLRLVPAPFDASILATEVVDSFQDVAKEKDLRLTLQAPAPLMVTADRVRLAQVFYNLLTNAIKFTPAGGSVSLRCAEAEGELKVDVQDSGRGLTPEEAARLFQPFSQVHAAGEVKEPGTGLGLFICKGLVEAHGGTIQVKSPGKGSGTTFTFRVPLRPPVP